MTLAKSRTASERDQTTLPPADLASALRPASVSIFEIQRFMVGGWSLSGIRGIAPDVMVVHKAEAGY